MVIITHCMRVINNVKDLFEIYGKHIYKSRLTEINGILYRIDLCKEHYNELNDLEKKNK